MNVGKAIRDLRLGRGMTQADLAGLCFMSTNAMSRLETGKAFPPRSTVERICSALCVPVAYLLMASIEEEDFPDGKHILYRTQLEPLLRELIRGREP